MENRARKMDLKASLISSIILFLFGILLLCFRHNGDSLIAGMASVAGSLFLLFSFYISTMSLYLNNKEKCLIATIYLFVCFVFIYINSIVNTSVILILLAVIMATLYHLFGMDKLNFAGEFDVPTIVSVDCVLMEVLLCGYLNNTRLFGIVIANLIFIGIITAINNNSECDESSKSNKINEIIYKINNTIVNSCGVCKLLVLFVLYVISFCFSGMFYKGILKLLAELYNIIYNAILCVFAFSSTTLKDMNSQVLNVYGTVIAYWILSSGIIKCVFRFYYGKVAYQKHKSSYTRFNTLLNISLMILISVLFDLYIQDVESQSEVHVFQGAFLLVSSVKLFIEERNKPITIVKMI